MFAISSNAPGSDKTFEKLKDTIDFVISEYGVDRIRYGVLTFGATPSVAFAFPQGLRTTDQLRGLTEALRRPAGLANLEKALRKAKEIFDDAPDRPRVKKVLVVVMDTKSSNDAGDIKEAARPLEKDGVKVGLQGNVIPL